MHPLQYSDLGRGKIIVLLHGFLETREIWNDFSLSLSLHFRVIAFDLPGFGQSAPLQAPFTIDQVATSVLQTLANITSEKVCLVGHSLGGYVSLAMVQLQPERFHSFAFFRPPSSADTPKKKEARTKTIDFVERNGATAFTSHFVPPLFANQNHPAIPAVTAIAKRTSQQTIVNYLAAMRDRPDRTIVLQQFTGTILFFAGQADTVIPVDAMKKQSEMAKNALFKSCEGVGHMGMYEAASESMEAIFLLTASKH
jgi:pimeloyl-ACP methyl ester carboxylesterase